jgi:hypothetical protein
MPRILSLLLLLCAAVAASAQQYDATITVSRVLLDARITTADGTPITDLKAADFTVKIGGAPAKVVSATWNDETSPQPLPVPDEVEEAEAGEEPLLRPSKSWEKGRTIVIFVQTDFGRAGIRVAHQMAFRTYAEEIVRSFNDGDRVAVFSFDSHLKFRSDLTNDRDAVVEALRQSILIDEPGRPPAVPEPSLAPLMDERAMLRAVSSEEGMLLIANALKQIEGPKTMLLLGWGLGEKNRQVVVMRHEWKDARAALQEARVTIIALNTGAGGELSLGLEAVAKETGGFYAATFDYPRIVTKRVQETMRGRWDLELVTEKPLAPGTYEIDVRVKRRGAVVLAPTTITIAEE